MKRISLTSLIKKYFHIHTITSTQRLYAFLSSNLNQFQFCDPQASAVV